MTKNSNVLVTKQQAVIVDLDGTLCDHRHRLHHICNKEGFRLAHPNWSAYNEALINDSVNEQVRVIAGLLKDAGRGIILLTGRMNEYWGITLDWLILYEIRFDMLIMREDDDFRQDYLFKKDVYEQTIQDIYNVELVLEDKESCVNMWKDAGLFVLQPRLKEVTCES